MERNVLYTISVSLKLNFYGSFSLISLGKGFGCGKPGIGCVNSGVCKMRAVAPEAALQVALQFCSREAGGTPVSV